MHREWYSLWLRLIDALGFTSTAPVFGDLSLVQVSVDSVVTTNIGGIAFISLDAASEIGHRYTGRLPNDYISGTPLSPYVEWVPTSAGAGDVMLRLRRTLAASGETLPAFSQDIKTVTVPGVDDRVMRTTFADIPGTGLVKGTIIAATMLRLGADIGDTYADPIVVLGFGCKYRREGIGWEVAHP